MQLEAEQHDDCISHPLSDTGAALSQSRRPRSPEENKSIRQNRAVTLCLHGDGGQTAACPSSLRKPSALIFFPLFSLNLPCALHTFCFTWPRPCVPLFGTTRRPDLSSTQLPAGLHADSFVNADKISHVTFCIFFFFFHVTRPKSQPGSHEWERAGHRTSASVR